MFNKICSAFAIIEIINERSVFFVQFYTIVINFFFSSHKNGRLYSLLLLFSCFGSIFILNTNTEKCTRTKTKFDGWWEMSALPMPHNFIELLYLLKDSYLIRVIFFSINHLPTETEIFYSIKWNNGKLFTFPSKCKNRSISFIY